MHVVTSQSVASARSLPLPGGLRLAVVGAGALGSEVCRLLAVAGHAHVLVIDPDVLEPRNIPLSTLFQQAGPAIGVSKARIAVEHARRQPSALDWQYRAVEGADVGLADLRQVDVLLSATDSTLARLETTFAARTLGLPIVDGGLHSAGSAEGRVTWFPPEPAAACTLCGLSAQRRAEVLAYALSPSLGCALPPDFVPMSGLPAAATAVAQAMLRLLAAQPQGVSFAERIGPQPATTQLTLSPSCPWHDLPSPGTLIELGAEETFADALDRLAPPDASMLIEFPWPICLRAYCTACRAECRPMCRTAYARRRTLCPGCNEVGTLDPLATLGAVWAGHALAACTPAELGLPNHQLYSLRPRLSLR